MRRLYLCTWKCDYKSTSLKSEQVLIDARCNCCSLSFIILLTYRQKKPRRWKRYVQLGASYYTHRYNIHWYSAFTCRMHLKASMSGECCVPSKNCNTTLNAQANFVLTRRLQRWNRRLELLQAKFLPLPQYSAQWDTVLELSSYEPLAPTVPGKVSSQWTVSAGT